jgi:hypothetical protein
MQQILESTVETIAPVSRRNNFYRKVVYSHGIPVKSADAVDDEALLVAARKLNRMLDGNDSIVNNLKEHGAELHVLGRCQRTTDLPAYSHFKRKRLGRSSPLDTKYRGSGLYATCSEVNLLELAGDRYAGFDLCSHEFAHVIYTFGTDPEFRERFRQHYRATIKSGLWSGCYAASSDEEFFAELSTWYFGSLGDCGSIQPKPESGPEWLERYDPQSFDLLEELYTGELIQKPNPAILIEAQPATNVQALKSITSYTPVSMRFVNTGSVFVKVYWINYQGKPTLLGKLAPGEILPVSTFKNHPWMVKKLNGDSLGVFFPQPEISVAKI